jgi:hypothetical protein
MGSDGKKWWDCSGIHRSLVRTRLLPFGLAEFALSRWIVAFEDNRRFTAGNCHDCEINRYPPAASLEDRFDATDGLPLEQGHSVVVRRGPSPHRVPALFPKLSNRRAACGSMNPAPPGAYAEKVIMSKMTYIVENIIHLIVFRVMVYV